MSDGTQIRGHVLTNRVIESLCLLVICNVKRIARFQFYVLAYRQTFVIQVILGVCLLGMVQGFKNGK